MKNAFLTLALFVAGIGVAQKTYELKGEISGTTNSDLLYVQYQLPDGKWKSEDVKIKDGHFSFTGQTDEPLLLYVYNNPNFTSDGKSMGKIYVEPGTMTSSANYKDLSKIKVEGSKAQDDLAALATFKSAIVRKQDSVVEMREIALQKLQSAKNETEKTELQKQIDQTYLLFDKLWVEEIQSELQFFDAHRNSFAAPAPLVMRIGQGNGVPFRDQIAWVAKNLSVEVKNSRAGKALMQRVSVYESSKVGNKANEFSLVDIGNKRISLSDYVGKKYVLLDFWASYCAPCRGEYPELKPIFAKYPNLEVINVSKDENLDSWKKAIEKDKIGSWRHVSVKSNSGTKILDDYNVIFIPVKVLVGPDGKIVARWEGSGDEQIASLKNELKIIFE